jgi:hypothetical protein
MEPCHRLLIETHYHKGVRVNVLDQEVHPSIEGYRTLEECDEFLGLHGVSVC